uniref:Uncharacterized protein n=1 Tax=viral metagenome TaxID=1070528 RepID=A0A6M3LDV1_9ZZZZ
MNDKEFQDLKDQIRQVNFELERLQAIYRKETGQRLFCFDVEPLINAHFNVREEECLKSSS